MSLLGTGFNQVSFIGLLKTPEIKYKTKVWVLGTSQYYGAKVIWNCNGMFAEPTISWSKLNFEEVSMTSLLLCFWIESIICEKNAFKKKPLSIYM